MKPKKYIKKQKFVNTDDVSSILRNNYGINNGGNTIMEITVNGNLYRCLVFHEPVREERTLGFDDGNARGFHRINRVRFEPMIIKILHIFDNIPMGQFINDIDSWMVYGLKRNVSLVRYNSDGMNISTTHLIGCFVDNIFTSTSIGVTPDLDIRMVYDMYNITYNNVTN